MSKFNDDVQGSSDDELQIHVNRPAKQEAAFDPDL